MEEEGASTAICILIGQLDLVRGGGGGRERERGEGKERWAHSTPLGATVGLSSLGTPLLSCLSSVKRGGKGEFPSSLLPLLLPLPPPSPPKRCSVRARTSDGEDRSVATKKEKETWTLNFGQTQTGVVEPKSES